VSNNVDLLLLPVQRPGDGAAGQKGAALMGGVAWSHSSEAPSTAPRAAAMAGTAGPKGAALLGATAGQGGALGGGEGERAETPRAFADAVTERERERARKKETDQLELIQHYTASQDSLLKSTPHEN